MKRSSTLITTLLTLAMLMVSCGKADTPPSLFPGGSNPNPNPNPGFPGSFGNVHYFPMQGKVEWAYRRVDQNEVVTNIQINAGDHVTIHSSGYFAVHDVKGGSVFQYTTYDIDHYSLGEMQIVWKVGNTVLGNGPFVSATASTNGVLRFGYAKNLDNKDHFVSTYWGQPSHMKIDHLKID